MAIYMNYNNLAVKGDVTEENHKDWILITQFDFNVKRTVRSTAGRGADRATDVPEIEPISVSKQVDCSSNALFAESLFGKGVHVKVDFTNDSSDGTGQVWQSYDLSEVIIASYEQTASATDHPTEKMTLSFMKIIQTYNPMNSDGTLSGKSSSIGYDLKAHKKA